MNESFHISELIARSIKNELTEEERGILNQWIAESEANKALFEKLSDNQELIDRVDLFQKFDPKNSWSQIEESINEKNVIPFRPARYLRYAAAIVLPLMASIGLIYYFMSQPPVDNLAGIDEKILPGVQRATLTLADGGQVSLEGNNAFTEAQQGHTTVKNEGAGLVYSKKEHKDLSEKKTIFNELTTPYGGQYQVMLADGTQVTLNAGSSLKYPVTFEDSTREVYLEGEAYFQVAHDGKPFTVNTENMDVRVLGTSFNVSAYKNETTSSTTLVEGSVKLFTDNDESLLVPGDQGIIASSEKEIKVSKVNTDVYTSWVSGKIEFENEDLDGVMRKLARWYDFEYEFQNKNAQNYHFTARIDNSQSISSILEMLELTTKVKFELKNETIVIL